MRFSLRCWFGYSLLVTLALVPASAVEQPFISKEIVFRSRSEGYHTFRAPGLVATKSGALLLFSDGRVNGVNDIGKMDLVVKRSADGGKTWGPLRVLATDEGAETKIGNVSALLDDATGAIHVIYCKDLGRAFHLKSTDEGLTFQPAVEITDAFRQFPAAWKFFSTGHAHGIRLASGRLVTPVFMSNIERVGAGRRDDFRVGVIYSDDQGATWRAGGLVPESQQLNENTLYETADGGLVLNARTLSRTRVQSVSKDGGLTWSAIEKADPRLFGARCQASSLVTRDAAGKRVLLFTNPTGEGDIGKTKISKDDRRNLTVRLSYDDGKTWPFAKVIESDPSGYGDLAVLPDGTLCIGYETGVKHLYETLSVARFNLAWILSEPQALPTPLSLR